MAADLSVQQAINRLVCCELPAIKDRVLETSAWTDEGVRARKQMFAMFRKLRRLAVKTENEIVVEGVKKLIGIFKADLPNLLQRGLDKLKALRIFWPSGRYGPNGQGENVTRANTWLDSLVSNNIFLEIKLIDSTA